MAITTVNGIINGLIPPVDFIKIGTTAEALAIWHSHAYAPGFPIAAVAPSPGLTGTALTSYSGQLPWVNPSSGNTYLAYFEMSSSSQGQLMLYDRLWHNSGLAVTTTTAQAVNSVTWPARDRSGATNGDGIMVGIEVSTATTNAGVVTNTTMEYTNSAGGGTRTATMASFPATAVAGTFVPFELAAGDNGVGSIQNVTLGTSYGAGAIHLVAYRPIASAGLILEPGRTLRDYLSLGLVRLYNDSVLFFMSQPNGAVAITTTGIISFSQG